ncbi:alpha-hydroxy acid oxidase [Ramlibacter sp. PS3R-8]|uniref:alpha-hydroxy acid oxidase n=1 Tax=Ramlibacter sp. PS3R-8 TaxID=3133437 RepID=UPI0030950DB2
MKAPRLQALPADVGSAADYEAHARRALDDNAWTWLAATAGAGSTARDNGAAWDAIRHLPRVLRKPGHVALHATLLGRPLPWPVLAAPMALQRLAHDDGEIATALAASAQGAGMVLSSQASMRLETVAEAVRADTARGPLWFQLYLLRERAATLSLVRRAEAAGYEAIVLTVDAAVRASRSPFRLPPGVSQANLAPSSPEPASLVDLLSMAPGWDDVAWLRAQTRLPVLLKGVLHPEDAREAVRHGVAGLIVSNHGGRTLDGAVATATALPGIVDAVAGALPVLVDGGIRSGNDVFKALALGARAVLLGRPVLWGLATAGAAGTAHVLRLLRDELELAMAQCGAASLADVTPDLVAHPFQRQM